jgi:hypothetical protein
VLPIAQTGGPKNHHDKDSQRLFQFPLRTQLPSKTFSWPLQLGVIHQFVLALVLLPCSIHPLWLSLLLLFSLSLL